MERHSLMMLDFFQKLQLISSLHRQYVCSTTTLLSKLKNIYILRKQWRKMVGGRFAVFVFRQ